jgi:hypothetical protein
MLPQRCAGTINRAGESGESREIPLNQWLVAVRDRLDRVFDLDGQQPAALPKVLDGPAGRRRAELLIAGIDVCAGIQEECRDRPVAALGRIVKGRGAVSIPCLRKVGLPRRAPP